MGNRFINPNPQYFDNSGNALSGGTLTFYTTGTSTLAAIYTTAALATQQSNPLTLDSAGRSAVIFLDPATTYKAVLKDADGNEIWNRDPVVDHAANLSAAIQIYPGNPNGSVAGSAGALGGSGASMVYDTANALMWVCTTSGVAASAVWQSVGAEFSGAVAYTGSISPTALAADQDNYAPSGHATASVIRQDLSANVIITGLDGDTSGAYKRIFNASSAYYITLAAQNASSDAEHRFGFLTNVVLGPKESADLIYDGSSLRWRLKSTTATRPGIVTLTDDTTIAWDLSTGGPDFQVTLAGNRTLGAFTNGIAGQRGRLIVIEDGTGGRTLDLTNAVYDGPGGAVGLVSSGADEKTVYEYYVYSATSMLLTRLWVEGKNSIGFYKEYDGGVMNNDSIVTQAHGLGRIPALVTVRWQCTTDDTGWVTGDSILSAGGGNATATDTGYTIAADTTNVYIVQGANLYSHGKATFNNFAMTNSSWNLYIRVYD
jgi:hypothetical protein